MKYRLLLGTDLEVSELGVGCARIGGVFQNKSQDDSISLLRSAFDAGITFYDTADMYAQGESERLLGRALGEVRDKVVIASKVGYLLPPQRRLVDRFRPWVRPLVRALRGRGGVSPARFRGSLSQDFSPDYIAMALKGSLARLNIDYLDIYLLHGLPQENREEAIEALKGLKALGLIRHYGVSCEAPGEPEYCLSIDTLPVLQLNYSVLHQEVAPLVNEAMQRGIGIVGRQCYASGLLARPSSQSDFRNQPPERLNQVQRLEAIASQFGRELPEMALKFATAIQGIDVTLVGVSSVEHIKDAIRFLDAPALNDSEIETLSALSL
jgi:aryl-alcohol dehydrogenase-like predicted oxidoreductase